MAKAEIREKYQGLSSKELLDKAYEFGFNFEKNSQSCSQCTVATIHELLDIDDVVVRVATSICGGSADQVLGTCGGLAGGIIVLDYYFGRPVEKMSYQEYIQTNIDAMNTASEVCQLLVDKFVKEYGTFICGQIQRQLFGRIYCLTDPDEMKKMDKAGGHLDKCTVVVGKAARWVMEIMLDKHALDSGQIN